MSNDNGSCLASAILIGTIGISIGSGVLAWNWTEPKSFFGAIAFLLLWGLLSYIGHIVIGGICYALFDR